MHTKQKQGIAAAGEVKPVVDDGIGGIGFAFHAIVLADLGLGRYGMKGPLQVFVEGGCHPAAAEEAKVKDLAQGLAKLKHGSAQLVYDDFDGDQPLFAARMMIGKDAMKEILAVAGFEEIIHIHGVAQVHQRMPAITEPQATRSGGLGHDHQAITIGEAKWRGDGNAAVRARMEQHLLAQAVADRLPQLIGALADGGQ